MEPLPGGGSRPVGGPPPSSGPPPNAAAQPPPATGRPEPPGEPEPSTARRPAAKATRRAHSLKDALAAESPPAARRSVTRDKRTSGTPRTLGSALAATVLATIAPGSGHLLLHRFRTGGLILGTFLIAVGALAWYVLTAGRADLLGTVLSTRMLVIGAVVALGAALAWIAVIVRTWLLAKPKGLDRGRTAVGLTVVTALCLLVAAPLGYGANLANSQRNLLDTLFTGGGGTSAAEAIAKPRLNILLVGSDAGPDREGARTDTMMVASLDTRTGRTILFGLPRNIAYAQFPPGSPMAAEFPNGFHNRADPSSGDYLLNAVYAYGRANPQLAPQGPTADPGLNLLHQTVSHMLGLQLDYYLDVNMAGFASLIDALGGLTVDVGPERIPIGGITPSGRLVRPDGYIEPGVQQLNGAQALAFARSRTGTSDYKRMGRQRCLIQYILQQKSPTDLLTNFQDIATATTNSVATNIPQEVLPALVSLAGSEEHPLALESISFDPNLADPSEDDGRFNTGRPNYPYMREVVQKALTATPAPATPEAAATAAPPTSVEAPTTDTAAAATTTPPPTAEASSLAASCG